MHYLLYLQPLTPLLSAMLLAVIADILLRLLPQARDRMMPLLGLPARLAASLNRKLNRAQRAHDARYNRGIFTFAVVVVFGFILGLAVEMICRQAFWAGPVVWFLCFQVTFPWTTGMELLQTDGPNDQKTVLQDLQILQRHQVSILVPALNPDRHAIARMFIEAAATSLHRGFLSPVLWAVAVQLCHGPAMLTAILVVTLLEAERVLVTTETRGTAFVLPFELAEAVINFVPARIAAFLWALGAFFTPGAKPLKALRAMFVQSAAHRAANSGWPVAAVAGALHVALPGGRKRDLWVGMADATARAEKKDIRRAIFLHAVTLALGILIFTSLLLLSIGV